MIKLVSSKPGLRVCSGLRAINHTGLCSSTACAVELCACVYRVFSHTVRPRMHAADSDVRVKVRVLILWCEIHEHFFSLRERHQLISPLKQ